MHKRLSMILAAATLAALAPAQVTKSGAGYLLRVKYSPGQVIKLNSTNKIINATGQVHEDMVVGLPVVMRIISVDGPIAQARMTVGPAMMNGNAIVRGQTVVMRLNNRNQASGAKSAGASVGATLPEKPVKVGQTWQAMAPISTGTGMVQKVDATYTFVGVKTLNGQGVAVVTYEMKGAARGRGTMTILQKDGTLWTNDLTMQFRTGDAPLKVISKMKRI